MGIVITFVFALIALAGGGGFIRFSVKKMKAAKDYTETSAVITKITTYHHGEDIDHTVSVQYTVNGREYNEDLGYYQMGFREGKEIEILYNPENPQEITQKSNVVYYIFIFAGAVACLIGLGVFALGILQLFQ